MFHDLVVSKHIFIYIMHKFVSIFTTPLFIGILHFVSTSSPWFLVGSWMYVVVKTLLGSISTCVEYANKARRVHIITMTLLCGCDVVSVGILASLHVYDPLVMIWLIPALVFVYTCQFWECCDEPRFRLQETNGNKPSTFLLIVDMVWLWILNFVVLYLFSDLTCIHDWMYALFFCTMMMCWVYSSILSIQLMGAFAPFRNHVQRIHMEDPFLSDTRRVYKHDVCRLRRMYIGFSAMFILFTTILALHFSWASAQIDNSTCLFNISSTNSSQILPDVVQIDAWATTNLFTIALMIPSTALFMINLGMLFTVLCKR